MIVYPLISCGLRLNLVYNRFDVCVCARVSDEWRGTTRTMCARPSNDVAALALRVHVRFKVTAMAEVQKREKSPKRIERRFTTGFTKI